ncbi:MAG TPA: hypothetical protein VFS36_03775 [Chitinophagaceae bacterium]|nr:hypothetical protein [Chitinophagaceae bacterium]
MKTNGTRMVFVRSVLLILLCLYFLLVFAHPRQSIKHIVLQTSLSSGKIGQISRQVSKLVFFKGSLSAKAVELQWSLVPDNHISTVVIERKDARQSFKPIAQFWINFDGNKDTNFHYVDKQLSEAACFYRLQLLSDSGRVEVSKVLSFNKKLAVK